MDLMKSDMGGAATVIGTIYAVSKNEVEYKYNWLNPRCGK